MQRNIYLVVTALFILLFVGVVLYHKPQIRPFSPHAASPSSLSPSPSPAALPEANIVVSSPKPHDPVSFPILITGKARVFENQLNYRIKDTTGKTLSEGNTMANAPDAGQFGPFTVTIQNLGDVTSGQLSVEVFDNSAKDGSEIDKVTVPVTLQ